MITILFYSLVASALTMFLNYCMGKPGAEFSPYEIFSWYSVWLAKQRLKKVGLFNQYSEQYHENLKRLETQHGALTLKTDFKKVYYDAAEPFFTWERMAGMCPVCFGFWVSLILAVAVTKDFVQTVSIIVISHILIRIFIKIL